MKVAIDMRTYQRGGVQRGIGEYTRNFIYALANYTGAEITLLGESPVDPIEPIPQVRSRVSYISNGETYDVLHVVDPMSIYEGIDSSFRLPVKRKITTSVFYDAIPLLYAGNKFSEAPTTIQAAYYARLFGLKKCDAVFAISEAAAKQYEQVHSTLPVIANMGIERCYREIQAQTCPVIDRPYIVSVGGVEPHKNIGLLAEAYQVAKVRCPDLRWVITGAITSAHKQLKLDQLPGVWFTGYLTTANIKTVIRKSIAVCMPSYIEGLGLPAYEGYLLGRPVLTQDIPAFADLTKNSEGVCKLPNSVESWATEIRFWYDIAPTSHEAPLAASILEKYNWKSCVEKHVSVWTDLLRQEGDHV